MLNEKFCMSHKISFPETGPHLDWEQSVYQTKRRSNKLKGDCEVKRTSDFFFLITAPQGGKSQTTISCVM